MPVATIERFLKDYGRRPAVREGPTSRKIPGYCALCRSRCGCVSVVENGRLIAVEPNPDHPTGRSLCGKGRAAPELVYSPDRLLYPMKRTRPKGDPDPGWQRIGWDEALDRVAHAASLKGIESLSRRHTGASAPALVSAR